MKILITGNLGYLGPVIAKKIREDFPNAKLIGIDTGFYDQCITSYEYLANKYYDTQWYLDIRNIDQERLKGIDAIVHLSAISNDPMGEKFENVTAEINYKSSIKLAELAKEAGVKSFTFASSCSVYGTASDVARTEDSTVNPLTAYAKSKVNTEIGLKDIASDNFTVTCLRFSTACGMSPRLRLDLVLNDFVAGAITNKEIKILSDGTPWRPLINVEDMGRAIAWSIGRTDNNKEPHIIVNVGANEWNYQVKDLAFMVKEVFGSEVEVSINENASPDKRSYKVDFSLYEKLAPNHQPKKSLRQTVEDLKVGLEQIGFNDKNYLNSNMIRLRELNRLKANGYVDEDLYWNI